MAATIGARGLLITARPGQCAASSNRGKSTAQKKLSFLATYLQTNTAHGPTWRPVHATGKENKQGRQTVKPPQKREAEMFCSSGSVLHVHYPCFCKGPAVSCLFSNLPGVCDFSVEEIRLSQNHVIKTMETASELPAYSCWPSYTSLTVCNSGRRAR